MTDDELHDKTQADMARKNDVAKAREASRKTLAFDQWLDVQGQWHALCKAIGNKNSSGITNPTTIVVIGRLKEQLNVLLQTLVLEHHDDLTPKDKVTKKDLEKIDQILTGKAVKKKPKKEDE